MATPTERLQEAKNLMNLGLITQQDYNQLKAQIMRELGLTSTTTTATDSLPIVPKETNKELLTKLPPKLKVLSQKMELHSHGPQVSGYILDWFPESREYIHRFCQLSFEEDIARVCATRQKYVITQRQQRLKETYAAPLVEEVMRFWLNFYDRQRVLNKIWPAKTKKTAALQISPSMHWQLLLQTQFARMPFPLLPQVEKAFRSIDRCWFVSNHADGAFNATTKDGALQIWEDVCTCLLYVH